ncbi:MAG: hypothetical protein ACK8QZ_12680 [Anaerolineales bacterium]
MLDDDARKSTGGETGDPQPQKRRRGKKPTRRESARRESSGPTKHGAVKRAMAGLRRTNPTARPERKTRRWQDGTKGRERKARGQTV